MPQTFSISNLILLLILFLISLAHAELGVRTHQREGHYVDYDSNCATALDGYLNDFVAACENYRDVVSNENISFTLAAFERVREVRSAFESLYASDICREYDEVNHSSLFNLYREYNHLGDDCFTMSSPIGEDIGHIYRVFLRPFVKIWIGSLEQLRFIYDVVVYWATKHGSYDTFVFVLSLASPWFPLAYLVVNNYSVAFAAPLMAFIGIDLRFLWLYVLLNILMPGFIMGIVILALLTWAIRTYRARRFESLQQVGNTMLFFFLLGVALEVCNKWGGVYPWLNYCVFLLFFLVMAVTFWARRTVTIEYTYVTWQNGLASFRSKPASISVEVDFPYTLLNPLNKARLWWVGIPWSVGFDAAKNFLDVAFVPSSTPPVVAGTAIPPPVRIAEPSSSSSSSAPVSLDTVLKNSGFSKPKLDTAGLGWNDPAPIWEAKGKNKTGRGAKKHLANTSENPIHFRRVKSAFWMSDPDLDVEFIREFNGDDWQYVEVADWDIVAGYIEVVQGDGSKQYIYYDPDYVEESSVNEFVLQPGQSVGSLFIIKKKNVSKESTPIDRNVLALKEQVDSLAKVIQLLCDKMTSLESNGTKNALPVQPPPVFSNPIAAFLPNGCFHHPSCGKGKSTSDPCLIVCGSNTCVHNSNCKPVVKEATPPATSKLSNKAKKAAKKKGKTQQEAATSDSRTLDSAVPTNPLVEYSDDVLACVVVVSGEKDTAYGVYTDRGVLTERHIVGKGKISVAPFYAKANPTLYENNKIVSVPGSAELVLLPGVINNCKPIDIRRFAILSDVGSGKGAIVCPVGSATGNITPSPSSYDEIMIDVGTKQGMCGCPYVVNSKIVALHAFGNNNGVNNSGLAITKDIKTWLARQPKN